MQTFLPFDDFRRSAEVLDPRRLGKQRVEGIQIVRALFVPGYAWKNHPAVLMWQGYEQALESYLVAVCHEWTARGFADSCLSTIRTDLASIGTGPPRDQADLAPAGLLPPWLGDEALHRSHRASLLAKEPEWYSRYFDPSETGPFEGYVWPVRRDRPTPPNEAPRD